MRNTEVMGRGVHLIKTIIIFALMILDVYFSFHVVFTDAGKKLKNDGTINAINFSSEADAVIYVIGIHFVVQLAVLFWMFFLIWKTFLFRFRLGTLCKQFSYLFIFFILNFFLYLAEMAVYLVTLFIVIYY